MLYRVLVTGSRDWPWTKRGMIHLALDHAYCEAVQRDLIFVLVHGACPTGADRFAEDWLESMRSLGVYIPANRYPADWKQYGRSAGYKRNAEMVNSGAELCLAFSHNNSLGTKHCSNLAERKGIETIRFDSSY